MQVKKITFCLIFTILTFVVTHNAFAIPALQIYVEGALYDAVSETWVTTSNSGILWVLGDVGHYGTIYDVELALAYDSNETGTISLIPTQASSVTDPSIPSIPIFNTSGVGTQPVRGDGSLLPAHGIYGPGTSWSTYALGNFTLTDSPIGDYTGDKCPDGACTYPDSGQINAYQFQVNGYTWAHFDTFDHIDGSRHVKYVFAPFSHDGAVVSEPATLSLLGLGLFGLFSRYKATERDSNKNKKKRG